MGERVDAVAAVFQALLARRCSDKGWSRVRVLLRVLRVRVRVRVLRCAGMRTENWGAGHGCRHRRRLRLRLSIRIRIRIRSGSPWQGAGLSRMLPFAETIVIMCSRVFIRLRSDEAPGPQAQRPQGPGCIPRRCHPCAACATGACPVPVPVPVPVPDY
jgi:hypothetical protein